MNFNVVSCRVSNLIITYVKKYRPDALPILLEGLDESYYLKEYHWMSYQQANLLFNRAEKIFNDEHVMVKIGEYAHTTSILGVIDNLISLMITPKSLLALSVNYADLITKVSTLKIVELSRHHAVIAVSFKPGFLKTRSACDCIKGIFRGLLLKKSLDWLEITEDACGVPIWEKGIIADCKFHYRQGSIWKEDITTGESIDLGPLDKDGTFAYQDTVYGGQKCVYRITWREKQHFFKFVLKCLLSPFSILEAFRTQLLADYKIIEMQNEKLQTANQRLQELFQNAKMSAEKLEAKIKKRDHELEKSLSQLKELDVMKSYFLSITSHELRTPLTIIKGALDLLRTGKENIKPEKYEKYFLMAQNNTERLIVLLDDLLDLSRLEFGHLKLELEDVDTGILANECIQGFQEMIQEKSLKVIEQLEDDLPIICADRGRIKQIINNLLSNAIKFTPAAGEISLVLKKNDQFVQLIVEDTGIGIDSEAQKQIFSKFYQSNYTLTREKEGIGMGLTIVKDLVELHDGHIWTVSELNKGTKIYVNLPIKGPVYSDKVSMKKEKMRGNGPLVLKKKR